MKKLLSPMTQKSAAVAATAAAATTLAAASSTGFCVLALGARRAQVEVAERHVARLLAQHVVRDDGAPGGQRARLRRKWGTAGSLRHAWHVADSFAAAAHA